MDRKPRRAEHGSVLVLALLVTMIILGIGLTVMWVASSGNQVSGSLTRRQEALYSAEAGIERARSILTANKDSWSDFLKGCTAATRDDPIIGFVMCDAPGLAANPLERTPVIGTGTTTETETQKIAGGGQLANLNYTIWIRNDWGSEGCVQITKSKWDCDDDGIGELKMSKTQRPLMKDNNGRVVLRAEGVGRDGVSVVTLEVVVTKGVGVAPEGNYAQAGFNAQGSNSARKTGP